MPVERLTTLVGFDVHRGCLAIGERPPAVPVDTWWREAAASGLVVAAEHVGNADNMGAVFRNALAFGAGGILLSPGCCDPLYRKSIRVSMGAALRIPYAIDSEWPEGLRAMQASEPEKAREILGFPSEWHLRIALSFGYPTEEEKLSAAPKKGGRRPLEEVIHWEKW